MRGAAVQKSDAHLRRIHIFTRYGVTLSTFTCIMLAKRHASLEEGSMPFSVFISYSHQDKALLKELEKHLSNLKRQHVIASWYDGNISPGTEWESQIITHLNTDQIILLLISADFMDSDFCYSIEMAQAIAQHDANQARVIPIILRPTDWKAAPFANLQVP